jgi:integrase
MSQLFDEYLADHRRKGLAETSIVERKVEKYLRPRLGHYDARTFGKVEMNRYIDERKRDLTAKGTPTRNGTINREIGIVIRSFRLAPEEMQRVMRFEKLDETDGIRQGIVSDDTYKLFLRELPAYEKPVWCFSHYTGVRRGQLLKLRREWVDWQEWLVRVPAFFEGERITKNGKPHLIPVYDEMREFLRIAWETANPRCPYLFQHNGRAINKHTFRDDFDQTRTQLGLSHVLFHDQRRTAVTNMIRAGIPPKHAMAVSGHKTLSMLERYNIMAEEDVQEVAKRMSARFQEKRKANGRSTDLQSICNDTEGEIAGLEPNREQKPN